MKKLLFAAVIAITVCLLAIEVFDKELIKYRQLLLPLSPISTVQVIAPMRYVSEQELQELLLQTNIVKKGFFNIDMNTIKKVLKTNPWIYNVDITKIWPDKLRISFEEDRPLAYLNNTGIITMRDCAVVGLNETLQNALRATNEIDHTIIPTLVVNENKYKKLCDTLEKLEISVKPIDVRIKKLVMSQRNSIYVELDNGLTILLGSNDVFSRMTRFVNIYDILNKNNQFMSKDDDHMPLKYYIDMRYRNGLAIGKKPEKNLIELLETA